MCLKFLFSLTFTIGKKNLQPKIEMFGGFSLNKWKKLNIQTYQKYGSKRLSEF